MFYFVSFNPKEGAKREEIVKAYRSYARYFEKKIPEFKLVGLYSRNVLLGSRPHYLAVWEFTDYSHLDEWNKLFARDKEGQKLAKTLGSLTTDWEAKVMSKLI
ncbi:MAG TPA: hypothetical protein VH878_06745 [Thermodesulfobacteriota bacterium]